MYQVRKLLFCSSTVDMVLFVCHFLLHTFCSGQLRMHVQSQPCGPRHSLTEGGEKGYRQLRRPKKLQRQAQICTGIGSNSELPHRGQLQRDPIASKHSNGGGLGLRKMTKPAAEGGDLQTTTGMEKCRKMVRRMRGRRRTSRRSA